MKRLPLADALDVTGAAGIEERESLDHILHRKHVDWKRAARGEPEGKRRETQLRFTEYNNQRFRESRMAENRQ